MRDRRGAAAAAVLAWMLLQPLASLTAVGQGQPEGTPYVAARLIGRWRAIMNNTLEESRAFAPEAVTELMEVFVSPGAVRLAQDKASEDRITQADAVVERFALEVVRAGARQPGGSVIVDDRSVDAAEKAVCPVYPFCER